MIFETNRLLIIEAKPEDIPYITELENHEENRHFVWQGSTAEHLAEIRDIHQILALVHDKETQEAVGYILVRLHPDSKQLELRRIVIDHKGQGYGKEILLAMMGYTFDVKQYHKFWLDVYPTNTIGIRLYENLYMHKDGILRDNYFNGEVYLDQIIYSILAPEWEALKAKERQ